MSLRYLLSRLLIGLLPLAITSTVYLYLYPVFSGCAFPLPLDGGDAPNVSPPSAFLHTHHRHLAPSDQPAADSNSKPAIFRLLVLADPQLEGDSSLPRPENELGARINKHWNKALDLIADAPFPFHSDVLRAVSTALRTLVLEDLPRSFVAARKRLDLLGNDYYLAHIYRTLHWWSQPTHVTVLGDLIGSQWVSDEEFQRRGDRYWNRVFRGGQRIDDEITRTGEKGYPVDDEKGGEVTEKLPSSPSWAHRIINIVGNHDIGYAGDASGSRLERFERVFGRADWDIRFQHPAVNTNGGEVTPTLHVINLNSLTLDGPPFSQDVQGHSYTYINDIISRRSYPVDDRSTFTLLLTHLPLHKVEGVCTDGPYFTFFDADDESDKERYKAGGLREQNHLSEHVSVSGVLQGIFGMSGEGNAPRGGRGRNGLILTGHDHTGCDVIHSLVSTPPPPPLLSDDEDAAATPPEDEDKDREHKTWTGTRYTRNSDLIENPTPSIREITLRSMMGSYGGNAGLLSLWFDVNAGEWNYAIQMCPAGVQHVWWAVHVVDLVTIIIGILYTLLSILGSGQVTSRTVKGSQIKKTQ
ncbi:hypothetical protein BJX70DRAFT_356320 [Aspergillus crustosus]